MQILELSAANDKEALKYGADLLQVEPGSISAKIYKKGSGGFLGLGSKDPSVYFIETIEKSTPVYGVMRGVVLTLLNKMGLEAEIEGIDEQEEQKICVRIASLKAGQIIGKRGKTLESLQFLTNLLVQQYTGEPPKILLDIENYRERRAKYLTDFALKMASQVIKYGKSRLMEPLNPFERRLIHVALQEDDRVETESEGVGVYKRVRIKSKKQARKGGVKQSSGAQMDLTGENEDSEYASYTEEEEEKLSQSVLVDPEEHESVAAGSPDSEDENAAYHDDQDGQDETKAAPQGAEEE